MSVQVGLRGKAWFRALTGGDSPMDRDPGSVLASDVKLGNDTARFLCVVPKSARSLSVCA
jgi:malonate decarboxylase gamma subunit